MSSASFTSIAVFVSISEGVNKAVSYCNLKSIPLKFNFRILTSIISCFFPFTISCDIALYSIFWSLVGSRVLAYAFSIGILTIVTIAIAIIIKTCFNASFRASCSIAFPPFPDFFYIKSAFFVFFLCFITFYPILFSYNSNLSYLSFRVNLCLYAFYDSTFTALLS